MKSSIFLLITVLIFSQSGAQDSTTTVAPRGKPFTAHLFRQDGSVQKGMLLSAGEDGIRVGKGLEYLNNSVTVTPVQIDKLYLRRKGSVGFGALIGAIAGAGIGAIIGAASLDESTCVNCIILYDTSKEEAAVVGGTIGLLSGAGLGMIIGSVVKKKFIIHGDRGNYKARYNDILERAMTQQ